MSLDDLIQINAKLNKSVERPIEVSSNDELAKSGRDMESIVAQKELEGAFNDTKQEPIFQGTDFSRDMQRYIGTHPNNVLAVQAAITAGEKVAAVGKKITAPLRTPIGKEAIENVLFILDYPARLTRSAMAITGVSAATERFGDIRKSQGFWVAMADTLNSITLISTGQEDIAIEKIQEKAVEQIKKIPSALTDPRGEKLPGISDAALNLGAPEQLGWVYDVVGELIIEANVTSLVKRAAKRGMAKITKTAYESGEEITKKSGIKRLLGVLDDDEIKAVADARKFKKVGKLGTKPPQGDIDGAINRTFQYIDETKDARITKGEFITAQRRQGAARMHAIERSAEQTGEYGQGFSARMRIAGRTTKAEKAFKPLLEASDNAAKDLTTLNRVIANFDFGEGKIFTQANAHESLAKLYEYGELLTGGEVELLRDVFGNDFANALRKFTSKEATGILGKAADVGAKTLVGLSATSRTLMTTGELSFLLRQANFRAWTRPMDAIRSFAVAARALVDPKYAQYMDDAMRFSAKGKRALKGGLFLGQFGDDVTRMTLREEVFMTEWLRKVPGLGKIVKGFERGYVSGLNTIRLDWFDEGMDILQRTGKAGDENLVAKWADYVNNMTGRANLDDLADAGKTMKKMIAISKQVLFAPRFTASKWNRHKVAAELIFGKNTPNAMRRMLAGDTLLKWRRYERLAHYATQNGFEVENDPRSSDFLKIKIGNTRFEVLGGDTQIQVLIARMVTGQIKDTTTGEIRDKVSLQLAQDYLTGKLNPLWSTVFDKIIGQTFEGEDIDDPKVLAKSISNKFWPLFLQDVKDKIFDGYEEEGKTVAESLEGSVSTITMGFLGAGIQTYEPSARKEYELILNKKSQDLYAMDFPDLLPQLKQEVMWEAEADDIDKIELLKEEMGMFQPTRKTAARLQKTLNKSFRMIRDGLGKDYRLFERSNVDIGEFGLNLGDIRLNSEQHHLLHEKYIQFLKQGLKDYPELKEIDPKDITRRLWLQDIVDDAREDARDEILFLE